MKTAMQELKLFISDGLNNYDESVKVSEIWGKINELLEKEKQQIIESAKHGANFDESPFKNAEDYYNETFK